MEPVTAVAIVGESDSGKTTLVERIVERLAQDAAVGTIKHIGCSPSLDTAGKDTDRHRTAGATETYGIAGDQWFAVGDSLSLSIALDRLARTCDYVIVEGYHESALPKIALGTPKSAYQNVVLTGETGWSIDLDEVMTVIDELEPVRPELLDGV